MGFASSACSPEGLQPEATEAIMAQWPPGEIKKCFTQARSFGAYGAGWIKRMERWRMKNSALRLADNIPEEYLGGFHKIVTRFNSVLKNRVLWIR